MIDKKFSFLGVILASGDLWREQRKFMARTLKEMTTGYKPFSDQILDEYHLFADYIRERSQSVINWPLIGYTELNILHFIS